MTTEIQTVAMTDPQLTNNNNSNKNNNNNNSNHNNNNDGEPKYLHKKFKKMATTEPAPLERRPETTAAGTGPSAEVPRKKDVEKDGKGASGDVKESNKSEASPESEGEPAEARKTGYVCPYCKLSCAKPSVLQKHIRAHTNERPYPCVPCGFAFKTKSNLYKHCRSRAHALKMEGGDASKVSEDSDISLSDSASNGTGTPPPPPAVSTPSSVTTTKTVKTGKIYKPKFHTGLQCVNNEPESSPVTSATTTPTNVTTTTSVSTSSSTATTTVATSSKPNAERLQEHIDKIITDNRAIVEAVDPRLHKLMQRQQSLVEPKHNEQPLNLSSAEESSSRKRCYSESFAHDNRGRVQNPEGSIIKDLLLKTRTSNIDEPTTSSENDNFVCPSCKIAYTNADNLEAHRRYYCKGPSLSPRRVEFQLDLDKRDDYDAAKSNDYYGTIQPLPSPGPLLGNTRLVDAYPPPTKKQRCESVPTTLRSLEELSKYPRPNSLQMFGGEVRILDNTGETKTMRIEPRQTNSPSNEHIVTNNKCVTTETASIVVRSGLHSGGTMVHKPPGTPITSSANPNTSISLPNGPKMLAPIVPNISTPNLAPTMTCYNYLEPHLNPLTSITAYNPLTLQQPGIASILHGGKVIPYVPGMPGPHTIAITGNPDISPPNQTTMDSPISSYKVIPGLPGLHAMTQPLDLASPVRAQTPNVPGIPGPGSNGPAHLVPNLGQPLDLASPARDVGKMSFKIPTSGETPRQGSNASPKIHTVKIGDPTVSPIIDKYRLVRSSPPTPTLEFTKSETDRHIANNVSSGNYKLSVDGSREKKEFTNEKIAKIEPIVNYPNGFHGSDNSGSPNSYGKRFSPKSSPEIGCRKRPANWNVNEFDVARANVDNVRESPIARYDVSSPTPQFNNSQENARVNGSPDAKFSHVDNWPGTPMNGGKPRNVDQPPPIIVTNPDDSATNVPNESSAEPVDFKTEKSEARIPKINEIEVVRDNVEEETTTKFLRPTSLPLKPGTFTPKRHHGITPTANTLPLISPETPRPKKSYGQLYLNGHAYTYLGLKCSTRVFYCTLNRPQPMYVTQQHGLSMYSNWKICKEAPPDVDMAHYDSRHRPASYTVAWKKPEDIMTHSSQRPNTPTSPDSGLESDTQEKTRRVKIFDGGFESNEDYTYVRGRGRGRYVCEECGIRCKKPSMLKKHIRTHTDVRPYTCKHCTFSFKTKGNLTKHMKSKAHYKKCVELGVMPVPTSVCDENIDKEAIARLVAGGGNADDSTDEDDDTDGDETDESGSEEQEAAQSLLSLSQPSSNRLPGLLPAGRPTTYPYVLTFPTSCATATTTSVVTTSATTAPMSVTSTTVIQSEFSHRYYFPSTRCSVTDEFRESVITSSKSEDSDVEIEEIGESDNRQQSSQPMDLTTKQTSPLPMTSVIQRPISADILTPVSEPIFMQTIVQTMERLPPPGRDWKPDAEGHMLQAYLTERHVMDSKMKQQYRVGCPKPSEIHQPLIEHENYPKQLEFMSSRITDSGSTPTVTYTDPSKFHHTIVDTRIKSVPKSHASEDVKMEIREKIYHANGPNERRNFDVGSIRIDEDSNPRSIVERDNSVDNRSSGIVVSRTNVEHPALGMTKLVPNERTNFGWDFGIRGNSVVDRSSPKNVFTADPPVRNVVSEHATTYNDIERSSTMNAMKMMTEVERSRDSVNQESRNVGHEIKSRDAIVDARLQSTHSPRNFESSTANSRPASREIRVQSQDYRSQLTSPSPSFHEPRPSSREFKLPCPEIRPPSREFKSPHQDVRAVGQEAQSTAPGVAIDVRPPSRDARIVAEYKNEQRTVHDLPRGNFDVVQTIIHETANKLHDVGRGPHSEARNSDRHEMKRHDMEITKHSIAETIKHSVARKMVVGGPGFRSPSPPGGGSAKPQAEFLQPSTGSASNYVSYSVTEDGRSVCGICNKVFSKPSQLRLHINIHYFERPFRCESCAVSFRTKGHLTKHERSVSHHNKVSMTSTFGAATTSNPRPFKCTDCKIAFRIHGHLAKHLRSKMHIMKLECLGKLPFGTYAEMERSGVNLNDIDTTDCDNSLTSLQILAQKLYEKDPTKMGQWDAEMVPHQGASGGETSSDEGEPIPPQSMHQYPPPAINPDGDVSRSYHMPMIVGDEQKSINDDRHSNYRYLQQRADYNNVPERPSKMSERVDDSRIDDFSHPYKCQICTVSVRTVNELQVHCFVEHNVESSNNVGISKIVDVRDNENIHKRISDDARIVDDDPRRRHSDDT